MPGAGTFAPRSAPSRKKERVAKTAQHLEQAIDENLSFKPALKTPWPARRRCPGALFLASNRARQITGITLPVEAGVTAGDPVNHLRDILEARSRVLDR